MKEPPHAQLSGGATTSATFRSCLRYGVNEPAWWHFAVGPHRRSIADRLHAIRTEIVRIYAFDKNTPDPVRNWRAFASYVQAVLDIGATPIVTFTRFRPPFHDAATVRWFAYRCADVVWNSIEQWGGETVRDWYWCIWDEPNSDWVSPGFTFEQYREVYLQVANEIMRWLGPYLKGRRALIGGPALDSFQPFWHDWAWRLVHEVDNALVGFLIWHRFGDWRAAGEWNAPQDPAVNRRLLIARTWEFRQQAAAVRRLTEQRGMLNFCGKLNVNAHTNPGVNRELNQGAFGAAFYAAALFELIRGAVHAELYWMGTDPSGSHGLWDAEGRPTTVFHAKQLFTQTIRTGHELEVLEAGPGRQDIIAMISRGAEGQRHAIFVHLADREYTCSVAELFGGQERYCAIRKIDSAASGPVLTVGNTTHVAFEGPGIAVALNEAALQDLRREERT
jgi:hypothetical protein